MDSEAAPGGLKGHVANDNIKWSGGVISEKVLDEKFQAAYKHLRASYLQLTPDEQANWKQVSENLYLGLLTAKPEELKKTVIELPPNSLQKSPEFVLALIKTVEEKIHPTLLG